MLVERLRVATRQGQMGHGSRLTSVLELHTLLGSLLALGLAPQHDCVYQRLWLLPRDVAEGGYELVKGSVDARSADELDSGLGLAAVRQALVDLLLGLADEGVEEVVQRVLADCLQLVGVLGVPRLRAVVVVASPRRPGAGRPLRLPLGHAAIARRGHAPSRGVARGSIGARMGAVGGKGLDYGFLRHDGSIERRAGGGDDLGAQRAGGRRVDEAGVARVLDAVHNGRVAVVGVRARGLALERAQGAVRAGAAAGGRNGRRLRARGDGARRGRQGAAAGLAGLARGRGGVLYMVRRIPSSRAGLQERKSSCGRKGQQCAAGNPVLRWARPGTALSNTNAAWGCVSR